MTKHSRQTPALLFAAAFVLVAIVHSTTVSAQFMGAEFNIQQFCEEPLFGKAAPLRQTMVYFDESMILPPDVADMPSPYDGEDLLEEWRVSVRDALAALDWYRQLEDKLSGSLLPSEPVAVLAIEADGNVRERGRFCWPAYTAAQESELKDRGFFENLFGSDPIKDLETQQRVFFASIRKALADGLGDIGHDARSKSYVRALFASETNLRSTRDGVLRVVIFGNMLEASDYADIATFESDQAAREAAQQLVNNHLPSFGGASFYVYGINPRQANERVRTFWDAFISAGQGQLASFGIDLALTAKAPTTMYRLSLAIEVPEEIDVSDDNRIRRGKGVVLAAEDNELIDSFIIVDGHFRSAINGQMDCGSSKDRCSNICTLSAETQNEVVFADVRHELVLEGPLSDMRGYIGEPDRGQLLSQRAYAQASASLDGCR